MALTARGVGLTRLGPKGPVVGASARPDSGLSRHFGTFDPKCQHHENPRVIGASQADTRQCSPSRRGPGPGAVPGWIAWRRSLPLALAVCTNIHDQAWPTLPTHHPLSPGLQSAAQCLPDSDHHQYQRRRPRTASGLNCATASGITSRVLLWRADFRVSPGRGAAFVAVRRGDRRTGRRSPVLRASTSGLVLGRRCAAVRCPRCQA